MNARRFAVALLAVSFAPAAAWAENLRILRNDVDASAHGYTVVRVWGTHREMGAAIGKAFAPEIDGAVGELRAIARYADVRALVVTAAWPAEIEDELKGIVDGVKAGLPSSTVDLTDVKALNSFSDWSYGVACRSHSAWGSLVTAPVKTLSTRRLDFGTPFAAALHHVVYAFEPADGSARWVNLSWPGVVTVVTAVDERGTLASLHDYATTLSLSAGNTFRSVAARRALTEPTTATAGGRRDEAAALLSQLKSATGTFINFYAPEGQGGVFTCTSGQPCGAARRPQADYFGGEVLLTANVQTDGRSTPSGAEFMATYYGQAGPKTLASHFGLMGTSGLHLLSLAYRGTADLTIWVNGRGRADRLELEWKDLFAAPAPDAGTIAADTGSPQPHVDAAVAAAGADAQTSAGADAGSGPGAPPSTGCGVAGAPVVALAFAALAALLRRRS